MYAIMNPSLLGFKTQLCGNLTRPKQVIGFINWNKCPSLMNLEISKLQFVPRESQCTREHTISVKDSLGLKYIALY